MRKFGSRFRERVAEGFSSDALRQYENLPVTYIWEMDQKGLLYDPSRDESISAAPLDPRCI